MKIFLTTIIFALSCLFVNAQQDRFIYLQTENHQPFFVKINNRVMYSNPPGYLIIPKLDDGLYSLVIGFPEVAGEQAFNCSIHEKDIGFIIKNSGEKEWQLLNVQTNGVIVPAEMFAKRDTVYEKESDAFSVMLANAVNDTTLLRKNVVKESTVQIPVAPRSDSTQTISLNTEIPKTDNAIGDSSKAVTAQESTVEKTNELARKDTIHIVSSTDILIAEAHKTDSIATKPVTSANADRSLAAVKDTVKTAVSPEVAITDPPKILVADTTKTDVAMELVTEKPGELKDSMQATVPNNDIAVTKIKKKKQKNEPNTSPEVVDTQKETVKIVTEKTIDIKDTVHATVPNPDVDIARSVIKRKSKKNGKEGMEMVYVDVDGDTRDTIRILIPVDRKNKGEQVKITQPDVVVNDGKEADVINDKNKLVVPITEEEKKVIQEANKPSMINSDCKNFASEDDFLKIRKKMVAENNDEDMIKAARKIFRTRCFTTEQVKNLSVLFLKDEGKYMFFDAAYPFVSDSDLYGILEKQLSDTYYINRFRAMVHK